MINLLYNPLELTDAPVLKLVKGILTGGEAA